MSRLSRLTDLELVKGSISNESIISYLPGSLHKLCLYSLDNLSSDTFLGLPKQLTALEATGPFQLDQKREYFVTTLRVLKLRNCQFTGHVVYPPELRELQLDTVSGNVDYYLSNLPTKYQT